MYEKSNSKVKSGQKKKKNDNKILLIVGLVFLIGILVTFIMRDGGSSAAPNQGNSIDKTENGTGQNGSSETSEGLNTVPDVEGVGPLTAEEVQMVKNAISADAEGYFKIVNKVNTVDENYKPENMVIPNVGLTKDRSNEQNLVRADIADDVEAFLGAAKEAGHEMFLSSGYRSYNLQSLFYNNDLQSNGGVETGYVAAPGTSEHHLGLAIDLTSHNVNLDLTDEFENTPEGQWALNNAYKYGFILRYKADKEDITGYKYEPWHYRYIGNKDISKLCHDKDITLEELLDYVK
ncbi:MAG: M15 family metallopeptidase [Clostridium sp.]|nr:M15 family metallopeptidase [Clostridium sp.]MDU7083255.1 M15 family metallopeptidase [Clostridium sp.]